MAAPSPPDEAERARLSERRARSRSTSGTWPSASPPDAVAYIHRDLADAALRMMGLNMSDEVCPAGKVSF